MVDTILLGFGVGADADQALAAEPGFHGAPPGGGDGVMICGGH